MAVRTEEMTIAVSYHGVIDDPPKEPRHLRFVTPSETSGHIGSEGVYLSSETGWYPDLPDSVATFRLRVALPGGWTAVTQARPLSTKTCPVEYCPETGRLLTEWPSTSPFEALTLAANQFIPKTREWTAKSGQAIQLAAYLLKDNIALADEYLDAAARYLDAYIPLLGPYPFDTFAVVENFFSSGLGMPAFTLLGSGVIKRHYVQPYALGHEIVHCWIGNGVFNRHDRGNWVEGLTTYLANYYWYEVIEDRVQARDQRHLFVLGYNLHVPMDRDYPVGTFTQKHDERDNAIGYQKTAMVFHLLRQEVGEEKFWLALKQLMAHYLGRHAEWRDVERVFEEAAGRDLRWFFAQWVERAGAPSLSIVNASGRPGDRPESFQLNVELKQTEPPFRLSVQLAVRTEDGRDQIVPVLIAEAEEIVSIQLSVRPVQVVLDPETMLIRRISRSFLPPVLNHYVTDTRRSVVLAFSDRDAQAHPFRQLVERIQALDHRRSGHSPNVVHVADDLVFPEEGSVLVLGSTEFGESLERLLKPHCGRHIDLSSRGVKVDGAAFESAGTALLASCHRADSPDSVVTVVYAVTPDAVSSLSRLLFFYGWNSFLVFENGAIVSRGDWPVIGDRPDRMEVQVDENAVGR
ncbi:MAG TPA: M1 family aminopeptidase [Nitrospira sp.]|nr:M1 family aminopeptidase [Nitrospira sp.]